MTPEQFAPEEWTLLKDLPFKVILATIVVDVRGPVGSAGKETVHGARRLVREAVQKYPNNGLIAGVLEAVAADPAGEEEISLDDELARQGALVEALALSERTRDILGGYSDSAEADEYKQWVYDGARAAAAATKSGGLLGFRQDTISDDEEEFLRQLATALGLELPDES